jgi:hypothetical protein
MLLSHTGSPNAARCGHSVAVAFQRSARYCVPFCKAMAVAAKARISDDPPVECNRSCLEGPLRKFYKLNLVYVRIP